jgi:hypothetical protein
MTSLPERTTKKTLVASIVASAIVACVCVAKQRLRLRPQRAGHNMFDFKYGFLKMYAVLELNCPTLCYIAIAGDAGVFGSHEAETHRTKHSHSSAVTPFMHPLLIRSLRCVLLRVAFS